MLQQDYGNRLPVSAAARRLAGTLVDMPLASSKDLSMVLRRNQSQLHPLLHELERAGLISSATLGSSITGGNPSQRWFFTADALECFDGLPVTWHEEGNRCVLLDRLQVLQWFYRVAGEFQDMGRFRQFLWIDSASLEAAVRYEEGWAALFWSGMLETSANLTDRFRRLPDDVDRLAAGEPQPWPGVFAVVAPDRWQREVVWRAAEEAGLSRSVAVWCASDGERAGAAQTAGSRGWLHQLTEMRDIGGWPWGNRVGRCIWAQRGAPSLYRVYRTVAEHPGTTLELVRQSIGEAAGGKIAERSCRSLVRLGLIEVVPDGKRLRYHLTGPGMDRFARLERCTAKGYLRRVMNQSWVIIKDRRDHEDGVMNLIGTLREAGISAGAGWRSYDTMDHHGAVSPDAVAFLTESFYDPGWHYIEYERSARSPAPVGKKLRNYLAPVRGDQMPVLVVCWNDNAEGNFHAAGGDAGLRMLTTTIDRLAEFGPLGNFQCWSLYGRRVRIG